MQRIYSSLLKRTGLVGVFYSPDVYSWLFDHSFATPEAPSPIMAVAGLVILGMQRRR